MRSITNDELIKISEFINSVDGLINGKFILADIKISNLLNMIATNTALYNYIKQCLIEFSFEKELSRAEVKNRFNNGEFKLPPEREKIVAFVFCLLVECDAKRMDFFGFINENFKSSKNMSEYANFAQSVLVPFKDIIIEHFYNEGAEEEVETIEEEVEEEIEEVEDTIYTRLTKYLTMMSDNVTLDRRIKQHDKENLHYIIDNIIYSMQYEDMNIINAFIAVLDILADKYAALRLPLKDIKSELLKYYNQY
ncbi:MAG: hypothetical protein E7359_03670 [Clostridiales bacterium]|nr:hypothetical protein [Clostridiales bacterium]